MPEVTPDAPPGSTGEADSPLRLSARPTPASDRGGSARPQGRDRAPRARPVHRVVAARAPLAPPAAPVRPRRARRIVGLGALPRLLRRSRLGGPRAQPAQPLLVGRPPTRPACRSTRTPTTWSRRSSGSGRAWSWSATGWAGCSRSRRPSATRSAALVLLSAELPRDLRPPARSHELREIPEAYGKSVIGWETLPEKLQRENRDLTLADVLRIQHLLGQKPHEAGAARRQMLAGVPVDRRSVGEHPEAGHRRRARPAGPGVRRASGWPTGSTRRTSRSARIRTTAWSSARTSYVQVADAIRAFLETHRL